MNEVCTAVMICGSSILRVKCNDKAEAQKSKKSTSPAAFEMDLGTWAFLPSFVELQI